MPEGIPESFESLKEKINSTVEKFEGKINHVEEQPIAFGLKALIVTVAMDESKETTPMEEELKSIEGISSMDTIDYRRAIE